MAIELKTSKRKPNKSIMIGEPVRASSPFYAVAVEFRDLLDRLGIQVSSITRELVTGTLPALKSFLLASEWDETRAAKLELRVVLQVTYEDGRQVVFDGAHQPAAAEDVSTPKVVKSRTRRPLAVARKGEA